MSWESGGIFGGVHTDVFIILNRDLVLQLCETGVGAVWGHWDRGRGRRREGEKQLSENSLGNSELKKTASAALRLF